MNNAQAGIFAEGNSHFFHLEYALNNDVEIADLKQAIASAIKPVSEEVCVVAAFGKQCWQTLQPALTPEELVDFEPLQGVSGYSMPSTQGDVMLWIQANSESVAVDQLLQTQSAVQNVLTLLFDISGFRYHDSRDLIGFVDGTANPKAEKRFPAAQINDGQAGAGGSYVLSQKWVHNLSAFNALPVVEQERTVGRTKTDDVELSGDAQPENSHVSRTDVSVNKVPQKIWRRSSPYANAVEQGLYFLSFTSELSRFDIQLKRMVGATEDGVYDRLMDYSTAVSGAYWFAPSQQDLQGVLGG
mgnify:CR=1 FL=1